MLVNKLVLKRAALIALGGYFSLYIEVRPGQPLVTSGPYRWVRHPCFLSSILKAIAVCLLGNAWVTMAIGVPVHIALYLVRVQLEEKALTHAFGEHYERYRRTTGELLPSLWQIFCLSALRRSLP